MAFRQSPVRWNPLPSSRTKLPQGMIRAIFVQGAIVAALFAPLAVLALASGAASLRAPKSSAVRRSWLRSSCDSPSSSRPSSFCTCLRLLCRLEKPRPSAFLRRAGTRNLLGGMEAQLDKLPLDLRSCRVPRAPPHRVSVPARSDALHFPAESLWPRHSFGLLDNRLAVAESLDARQCSRSHFWETWASTWSSDPSQAGSYALLRPPSQRPTRK